jgi:hypothetical protein
MLCIIWTVTARKVSKFEIFSVYIYSSSSMLMIGLNADAKALLMKMNADEKALGIIFETPPHNTTPRRLE